MQSHFILPSFRLHLVYEYVGTLSCNTTLSDDVLHAFYICIVVVDGLVKLRS